MAEVFIYGLPLLIALIAAAFLVYYFFPAAFPPFWRHAHVPNQGLIKRDWVATGRIDFATPITKITSNPEDIDQPTEFKLLVEERRIVESIAGNENLEIQWRLATLREAKAVITQYRQIPVGQSAHQNRIRRDHIVAPTSDDSGPFFRRCAGRY
jgi:hypothetical protein